MCDYGLVYVMLSQLAHEGVLEWFLAFVVVCRVSVAYLGGGEGEIVISIGSGFSSMRLRLTVPSPALARA